MAGASDIVDTSDQPRGQWRITKIKEVLKCKSPEQYYKIYVDLQSALEKSKLLGANFGLMRNRTKLDRLLPSISSEYCPEPSYIPSSETVKALTHLAHKVNANVASKAARDRDRLKKRAPVEQPFEVATVSEDVRLAEVETTSSDPGTRWPQLLSGTEFLTVKTVDKKIGAKLVFGNPYLDIPVPMDLYCVSAAEGTYPIANEEAFRAAIIQESYWRGEKNIIFNVQKPPAVRESIQDLHKTTCEAT
ncbi:MAG: hypothetical protein Q9221_005068 [Calogaya cf. arnoldii]